MKKKRKIGYWMAAVIFMCLLIAPAAQGKFDIIKETELKGIIEWTERLPLTVESWMDGSFQSHFSSWYEERIGFKPALVKTDNQINFSVFQEISASTKTKIVLGEKNQLYEKAYIDAWNGKDAVSKEALESQLADIELLERLLQERGIKFIFVISPTKPAVYPDLIDAKFIADPKGQSSYDNIVPLLEKYHITYLDSAAFLNAYRKQNGSYPVFSEGGTHWNYFGACLVAEELMARFELPYDCREPILDNTPYGTDRDLAEVINLWDDTATNGPTPHPQLPPTIAHGIIDKALFVGDSFVLTLTSVLDGRGVYSERSTYYYNSTEHTFPSEERIPIDMNNPLWLDKVLSHDMIIIEGTHTALDNIGFGFVQQLLGHLAS